MFHIALIFLISSEWLEEENHLLQGEDNYSLVTE
jgi:hypothetical protein